MASSSSCSSSNPFLFAFLSLVFFLLFFFSEDKSFVSAIITKEDSDELQLTHHHRLSLSSLLPSSSCTSPPQGGNRKGSLEVVHKHGPCSKLKLKQPSSSSSSSSSFINIAHSEILKKDEARVWAIQSKTSKKKRLDRVQIPAIPLADDYFITVGLGSPKRDLSLAFDTGSVITWTQCKPCIGSCYSQKEPIFDPSQSSSYSNLPCPSSFCSRLSSKCYAPAKACLYGVLYGDGSSTIGFLARETLTISSTDVVHNFLFGCGQSNRGDFGTTAGLFGLGRSPVSFVEQTAQKYRKIFSYCLPSTPSAVGYLNFGGVSSNTNVKYIPFSSKLRNSSFYSVDLIGIAIGGINLPISASLFSSGTIIDSGTTITRLPPAAYRPLRDEFKRFMSARRYPEANSSDPLVSACYNVSGHEYFYVPSVSLLFGGGVKLEVAATGTVYVEREKQVCLGFTETEKDDDLAVIGNTQQKTMEVVYDVGGERIGFRHGACN